VKPSYGLSDESITAMIKSSFEHAQGDIQLRALREQQVEADRVIESLVTALNDNGAELLDDHDFKALESSVDTLRLLSQQDDPDAIHRAIEAIGKQSELFASKRMDASIKKALAGQTLSELDEQFN